KNERKGLLLNAIESLKSKVGITKTLGDIGLQMHYIPLLAQNAINDPCLLTNPRRTVQRDIELLYEEAL
ncbi:MAG: iron-containing alcohol dehydrogenase, partial [Bacteroidales bacterium]|nr:iron-containing alcohol dehydrogenase [Bacteroidales bacterium]